MSTWNTDASANRFVKSYVNGFIDISGGDIIMRNGTIKFPDGTTQNSAALASGDISGNLTVGQNGNVAGNFTVDGTVRVGRDLFVTGNVSIAGELITETYTFKNRNVTGTANGYIASTSQMAYKDISAGVAVNDYVSYGTPNFSVTGDTGVQVSAIDTSNNLITFTGGATVPPAADISKNGYIIATNKIALIDSSGVVAGQGVKMSGLSINDSYISSVDASKNIVLPSATATLPTPTSLYGYIDPSLNLIFKQDVSAGYYYTSSSLPSSGINYTTNNVSNRSLTLANNLGQTFTQSVSYKLGVGAVYSETELICTLAPAGIGLANMFIHGPYIPRGAQIGTVSGRYATVKDASATPFTVPSPTATIDGYISGTTLTLASTSGLSSYNLIKGNGTPAPSTANNYIVGINTTNSTVTMGGSGTTASNITVSGYTLTPGQFIVSPSDTVAAGTFLAGSGITGRCRVLSQSGGLVTTNYTAAMTPSTGTDLSGAIINSSQFYYSGPNTPVVGRFVDCSYGTVITAYDASKALVTVSPAVAQITPVFQKYGWISSATNLELYDIAGIGVGSAVIGAGINTTKPLITLISGTTCVLAGTTMTPTASTTVDGYVQNTGSGYRLVFKQDVSTNMFVSGTGLSSTALTTSSGKSVTFNTFGVATATPIYYNNYYYVVSSTKISLVTTIATNTYMLRDNSGVFQDGTYITDISGYVCTIAGQTVTPTAQYAVLNGAVVADPSGGYSLYYGNIVPNANTFAYNPAVYTNAGFAMGIKKLGRCAYGITFSGTPTVTTKALNAVVGFYITNETIVIQNTTANVTALNSIAYGAMCEVGTDASNNVAMYTGYYYDTKPPAYLGLWISVSYPSGSGLSLPAQAYTTNTYGRPYNTTDYTKFYVGNISGSLPTVGDFIIFNNTTQNLAGIRVTLVSPIYSTIPPYLLEDVVITLDTAVTIPNGTTCYFYAPKTISVYNNLSLSLYNSGQCGLYAPVTFTVAQGSLYDVYTARNVKMYTPGTFTVYSPSTYTFYTTQNYYFYSDTSYNFSQYTPQTVSIYNPQTVQFYRINNISVPQTTDTMCVLNYPQTLTNKTLTSPTINGAASFVKTTNENIMNFPNGVRFDAQNSAGGWEPFMWPRWTDNVMYLNYGSAGLNIRNSSGVGSLMMHNNGYMNGRSVFTGYVSGNAASPFGGDPGTTYGYYFLPYTSTTRILLQWRHEIDAGARNISIPTTYGAYILMPFIITQRDNDGGNAPCCIQQTAALGNNTFYCDSARGSTDKAGFIWFAWGIVY